MKKKSSVRTASSAKPDFWDNLKSWQQHGICILFLLILPSFLHSPAIIGGQNLVTHDIIQWRAGAESLIQHREEFNEQAQWSTNMFSGMPAYVISNVERFPHFDTIIAPFFRSVFPLFEYWVLLLGGYVFLLLMGYRPLIAGIGAILIGFTTYIPIIVGAGHNTKFIAYAWIPWIFAGYKMMTLRKEWLLTGFAVFLFAFMMHIRAGHPQVTYYFLFLLGIWWIFDGIDSFKSKSQTQWFLQTGLLLGAGLLAAFSVVEQYWSVYDYSSYSIRGGSEVAGNTGLDPGYAFVWSQGWAELLTLSFPNLFGGGQLYWGPKPVTSGPHYFGAIGTLLLIIGLFTSRKAHLKVFLTAGILAVLFSLGKHFPLLNNFMFDYFPLFNKFRTPEMWLILAVFCFTIPAMDGLSWIADKAGQIKTIGKSWLYGGAAALGLGLMLLLLSGQMLDFEKEGERSMIASQVASQNQVSPQDPRVTQAVDRIMREQFIPERSEAARADILRYLILAGLGFGFIWLIVSGKVAVSIGVSGLLLLTAIDMTGVGKRYVPEHVYQQKGRDIITSIESQKTEADAWAANAVQTDEGWSYRVFPLHSNPFNNAVPSYFYPSIGGYSGAKMNHYQDVLDDVLFEGPTGINMSLLSMLNVRYMIYNGNIPGFRTAFQREGLFVLENEAVLPKAFFVDEIRQVNSPSEAIRALNEASFNPARTAILMESSSAVAAPDSLASVSVTSYNAHQITLSGNRSEPGFLVLGEIYYPGGWKAYLNGTEVPIYRTNYILRGIGVPAGTFELELKYEPDWYAPARTISNIANILALLMLAFCGWNAFRQRSNPAEAGVAKSGS